MLGSNNYLGLTGDPRVLAGRPRRARALRHRPDRLAPAQRHDRPAPRARGRARRLDGHRGRDRLHHRPPGQPRLPGDDPRPGRHRRRRLGRPRLDPRRLPALPGQAPRLPPQPPRPAREDARARPRSDGGGILVVVDGVFSMEGDVAPLPADRRAVRALRRAPDGRRGPRAWACSARAAPARPSCSASRTQTDLRMATFSKSLASCGGVIAGPDRGRRVPAHPVARLPLHRLGRPRRRRRRAGRHADLPLRRGPAALRPRRSTTPATCTPA